MLIEKEWLSFGHMFNSRHGVEGKHSADQVVPIFWQWLDCCWQVFANCSGFRYQVCYFFLQVVVFCLQGLLLGLGLGLGLGRPHITGMVHMASPAAL